VFIKRLELKGFCISEFKDSQNSFIHPFVTSALGFEGSKRVKQSKKSNRVKR
jgi:hypothetical protein